MSAAEERHFEQIKRDPSVDPSDHDTFARLTRIAIRTFGVPVAMIGLQHQNQVQIRAIASATPLTPTAQKLLIQALQPICQQVIMHERLVMPLMGTQDPVSLSPIDGTNLCFWFGIPLKTAQGQTVGAVCLFDSHPHSVDTDEIDLLHDLAALATAEIERQQSEGAIVPKPSCFPAEHEALIAALHHMVWMVDAAGRYTRIPLYSQAHPPNSNSVGKTLHEVFEPAQAEVFLGLIEYALTIQQPVSTEYTLLIGEQESWFTATLTPLPDRSVLWIAQDVTEREQAETLLADSAAQIHLIIDAVPVRIAYVDCQKHYRFVNRQYEEWFQLPAIEIVGKHMRDLLGETIYQQNRPRIVAVLAGEQVTHQDMLRLPDGREHRFEVTYVPHFGQQDEVLGFYVFVQDITDRGNS
jgi:PAS domain S-box-containing protein